MENLISNETHRRPKGMGSVYSLGKGRSKPWVASITTGRNQRTGKQIQTPLGYFKTKEQAEDCLILAYMKDKNIMPEDIKDVPVLENKYLQFIYSMMDQHILPNDVREIEDASIINSLFLVKIQQEGLNIKQENAYAKSIKVPTVKDIWLNLLDSDLKHLTKRSLTNYKTSFNNIKILHNKKINLISYSDIQPIFDKLMKEGTGQSKMNNIKIVLNYIFKYAMKYDYIEKNYASFIKFEDTLEEKQNKIPFTKKNIKDLLKHDDDPIVQSILIMIYTGMRPSELLEIKKENIHINERYLIGGIKTKNGIDRAIPIHESIVKYVDNLSNNELLTLDYRTYLYKFNSIKNEFKFECTPHSGRHTFASLANEYELNEFLIKRIMGHSAKDLTKDVYTHVDVERLVKEINKLPKVNDLK